MSSASEVIDLRSDTLSTPTQTMRAAMANAQVGDDVYGEDPTAVRLQERAAELLGHPAALFFPSGVMANQAAIFLYTQAGDEILVEATGHTVDWEMGATAALSGVHVRAVPGEDGLLDVQHLEPWLQPRPYYQSRVRLLVVENTHNMSGGRVVSLPRSQRLVAAAHEAGLHCHLDGARLFNAAVALDVPAAELAAVFDSVMVSLSKGLSAPVGSLLLGSEELICEARRVRKMFGGGMRQVGVLAAAGLVALDEGIDRLADDHAHARTLASELLAGGRVRLAHGPVQTNIVVLDVSATGRSARAFVEAAAARGVRCSVTASGTVRMVTYRDIGPEDIAEAVRRLRPIL